MVHIVVACKVHRCNLEFVRGRRASEDWHPFWSHLWFRCVAFCRTKCRTVQYPSCAVQPSIRPSQSFAHLLYCTVSACTAQKQWGLYCSSTLTWLLAAVGIFQVSNEFWFRFWLRFFYKMRRRRVLMLLGVASVVGLWYYLLFFIGYTRLLLFLPE
jgi:hypothetical protein